MLQLKKPSVGFAGCRAARGHVAPRRRPRLSQLPQRLCWLLDRTQKQGLICSRQDGLYSSWAGFSPFHPSPRCSAWCFHPVFLGTGCRWSHGWTRCLGASRYRLLGAVFCHLRDACGAPGTRQTCHPGLTGGGTPATLTPHSGKTPAAGAAGGDPHPTGAGGSPLPLPPCPAAPLQH